jgi:transposase
MGRKLSSISETVNSTIKRRFGGFVRSIKRKAQRIELWLKVIVHNLIILGYYILRY